MPRTMLRQFMLPLIAACIFAGPARSAEVQLDLTEVEPGAWDLFAKVNPNDGDVLGLLGVSGNIHGADPRLISFELGHLQTVDPVSYAPRGFEEPLAGPIGDQYFSFFAGRGTVTGQTEVMGVGIEPIVMPFPDGTPGIDVAANAHIGRFTTPGGLAAPDFRSFQVSLFPAGYQGLNSMPAQGVKLGDAGFSLTVTPFGGEPTVVDSLPSPTPYVPPAVDLPSVAPPTSGPSTPSFPIGTPLQPKRRSTAYASTPIADVVNVDLIEIESGRWQLQAAIDPVGGDTLGIAGFAVNVSGTPNDQVDFELGKLSAVDPSDYSTVGFEPPLAGPVADLYSVGALQARFSGAGEVMGVGLNAIHIEGAGEQDLSVGAVATLGEFTTPAGLSADNFSHVELALFPANYAGLENTATVGIGYGNPNFNLTVTPLGSESIEVVYDAPQPTPEPPASTPKEPDPSEPDPSEIVEQPPVVDPIDEPLEPRVFPIGSVMVDPVGVTPWLVEEGGIISEGVLVASGDLLEICDCRFIFPFTPNSQRSMFCSRSISLRTTSTT